LAQNALDIMLDSQLIVIVRIHELGHMNAEMTDSTATAISTAVVIVMP